ncbi:alpha/beta fold hydrolase [Halomonas organivorans]|uniref:Pimeloyl-ACP methyl ester carboxylesterase n=1 Tax=Halomonas organivorans TaxID=257772 RepID=A0A7W5C1T5_9GAMM|nr:alpha/beta fold hydrolase [Halomonas organivorans]MBB3143277.1 pimeloyl-ACP methyl ester carboxylesterase [Halomonas organivorans]
MSGGTPLHLAEGRLAALAWGEASAPTWLALHGWLDNAASFSRLAPLLVERLGIRLVALDFAGHGHSRHRPGNDDYAIWDYCHDALDALDELGLEQAPLLAHSMGAGVSCLLAAAFPERVEALTLIDGLGVLTTEAEHAPQQLRKGLRAHRRPTSSAPRYPDSESAVAARVAGGVTPIDADTARPLVLRNLIEDREGHLALRTDPRLLRPSPVRYTPEQAEAMLSAIRCPVLCVEGEEGIFAARPAARKARAAVAQLQRRVLPGGHHLHLEPTRVSAVAEAIVAGRT